MLISTKGLYALRVMLDLSQNADGGFISLGTISKRQGISMKYLEAIVSMLVRAEMLESKRGKDGGYRLIKNPKDYTVGAIIALTEGTMSPVSCLESGETECEFACSCLTLPIWIKLEDIVKGYLDNISLFDVLEGKV